jgi:hypothetical protein
VADLLDGFTFDCPCCGERHVGLPALVCPWPDPFWALPEDQREAADANDDFCVIDKKQFFVRATLRIPIVDEGAATLEYGIWGSLSETNFRLYGESFFDLDQSRLGGLFSYLSNALPGYGQFPRALPALFSRRITASGPCLSCMKTKSIRWFMIRFTV